MVARIAETCNSEVCTDVLIRGDQIEFVSEEQVRRVGYHPLNEKAMPSDIKLPRGYVLVHDTAGVIYSPCEFFIVKWYDGNNGKSIDDVRASARRAAEQYFGHRDGIALGEVDVPKGPWKRRPEVRCIRYRRHGHKKGFEHTFDHPAALYVNKRPLAWRVALPDACIVDARGFVRP